MIARVVRTLVLCAALVHAPAAFSAGLAVSPFGLFDPDGNSSLSANTADGFTASIAPTAGGTATQPRPINNFTPARMSNVGDSVQVSFSLQLANQINAGASNHLRLSLFDTAAGGEFIGLVRSGESATTRTDRVMRFRIDDNVADNHLGVGGGSRVDNDPLATPNNEGVFLTGITHSFSMLVTRTGADTLSYSLTWDNDAGGAAPVVFSFNSYNETNGDIDGTSQANDAWPGGSLDQFNGFAFQWHTNEPFGAGVTGGYTVSNFTVTGTPVPEPASVAFFLLAGTGLVLRHRRRV